jgi:hypothetical protein
MSRPLRRWLDLLFPRRTACLPYGWFSDRETRCLFELSQPAAGQVGTVDDATWSDLQGDRFLAASPCCRRMASRRKWSRMRIRFMNG